MSLSYPLYKTVTLRDFDLIKALSNIKEC